jgi:hypothetical protein
MPGKINKWSAGNTPSELSDHEFSFFISLASDKRAVCSTKTIAISSSSNRVEGEVKITCEREVNLNRLG